MFKCEEKMLDIIQANLIQMAGRNLKKSQLHTEITDKPRKYMVCL